MDSLSSLQQALQPVFRLEPQRNGRYTHSEVQRLKEALDDYDSLDKKHFKALLQLIKSILPSIEKFKVDFECLRIAVDQLSLSHGLPKVDWSALLSHSKTSPKFQFSALNRKTENNDLLAWLSGKTGQAQEQLDSAELTRCLLNVRNHHGFSHKLNDYLKKDPDFLFNLIMHSEKNFTKISKTRIILFLTDQQIAKAIVEHAQALLNKQKEPYSQVRFLVKRLNETLSNGLSISTLMRNTEARTILDNSVFFQIYHSDEYKRYRMLL